MPMTTDNQFQSDEPNMKCQGCGKTFYCGAATGTCWCMESPQVMPLPAQGEGCFCKECLQKKVREKQSAE